MGILGNTSVPGLKFTVGGEGDDQNQMDPRWHDVWRGGDIIAIDGLDPKNRSYATVFGKPNVRKRRGRLSDADEAAGIAYTDQDPRPYVEQLVFTLQTDERDGPADDGKRTLFIEEDAKFWPKDHPHTSKRGQLKLHTRHAALLTALENAGQPLNPEVGGKLWIKFLGTEPSRAPIPRSLWDIKYEAPLASSAYDAATDRPAYLPAPSELPAPNPKATAIAAIKLALAEVTAKEEIGALYQQYTERYGDDVWTPELALMADEAISRIAQQSSRKKNPYLV